MLKTATAVPIGGLKVLVADDNEDAVESAAMVLSLNGNDVKLASDGLEAVEAADRYRPDVVLLDIGMPKLNGFEACRRIRSEPWGKDMLVVAVTGWGQEEDRRRTAEAGFDAHFTKPVDFASVMALIGQRRALRTHWPRRLRAPGRPRESGIIAGATRLAPPTMSLSTARGVYVIAPTPFLDDGRVDNASVDRMTDFFLAAGVTGITVLGQMGEAPKLDHAEALDVAQRVIRRATVPVIVGVSAPGFAAMRALARASMEAGAAGVMIAPPNTLRTDDQIVGYFRAGRRGDRPRRALRAAGLSR